MLKLEDYKMIFAVACLIGILLIASPTLSLVLHLPSGERFSELWVLGSGRMAENYPFDVRAGVGYSIYVGVGNCMGCSGYYVVYVKFRNQTEPLPDTENSKPSLLPPLYEFRAFVADGGTWEAPLTFSVLEASRKDDSVFVGRLSINDVVFVVNASARWDSEYKGFLLSVVS